MRIRENSNGRPINVLLILADQHRSDCLGAYGNKDVYTPNIDSLAHDGMLFENCFCTSPLCTPSRYSMLTSLYAHQHRGWSNYATLSSGFSTFPRVLRKKGYSTKAVGKMHFAPTYLDVGFDELVLAEQNGPGRYEDDYHRYLKRKGLVDAIDLMDQVEEYRADAPAHYWESFGALESNLSDEDYSTTWIGEQAISAIEKWGETGNLLMVGFIKPHHPYDAPAEWNQMYDPDDLTVLPGWIESCLEQDLRKHPGTFPHTELTISKLRKVMAYYYASITQIDFHVGRMIKMLKEKNMYDNTMIIYTSDHGEYLGFHHLLVKKNYMYDPLVKIPLIIKYPDQQLAGTRSEALVTNLDIAPTILHQADCPSDELMQGKDLLTNTEGHDLVYAEAFGEASDGADYMARSKTHKLLFAKQIENSRFFDLEADPLELNNLFSSPEYEPIIDRYIRALAEWILFETPVPSYLDEHAPVVKGLNVPRCAKCRDEVKDYFRSKMRDWYLGSGATREEN